MFTTYPCLATSPGANYKKGIPLTIDYGPMKQVLEYSANGNKRNLMHSCSKHQLEWCSVYWVQYTAWLCALVSVYVFSAAAMLDLIAFVCRSNTLSRPMLPLLAPNNLSRRTPPAFLTDSLLKDIFQIFHLKVNACIKVTATHYTRTHTHKEDVQRTCFRVSRDLKQKRPSGLSCFRPAALVFGVSWRAAPRLLHPPTVQRVGQ